MLQVLSARLRPQQLCRAFHLQSSSCTAAACITTSSCALQQQQQQQFPQLMRLKQQPGGDTHADSQHTPAWRSLGAAAAAAAAAGAGAWAYSNSSSSTTGTPLQPSRLSQVSHRAQAAVAAAYAGPLLHLQHGRDPTPLQLQGIAAALEAEAVALGPELATGLWGLAMLGAVLPQQQLSRLAEGVGQQMEQLPVFQAIVAAWAITTLCSNSSTSSSSSSTSSRTTTNSSGSSGSSSSTSDPCAVSAAVWQQLLQRLKSAHHKELKDEACLLYLLHAAMQQAAGGGLFGVQTGAAGAAEGAQPGAGKAAADATGARAVTAAGAGAGADASGRPSAGASSGTDDVHTTPSSNSSNSSSSNSSRGSRAAQAGTSAHPASAPSQPQPASPAEQPHASLQEVLQQVAPLHALVKRRLTAVYQEYVPFQPYVEGPYLVVLHIAKTLPHYISAAAAAATAAGQGEQQGTNSSVGRGVSPLSAVFGSLPAADAAAAARLTGDPASLGKLKRDLFFRWRADELVDRHQQAVNQVAHVLHRRMQLPIQQGSDADVVLLGLKTAVFVVDDSQHMAGPTGCSPQPPPPKQQQQQSRQQQQQVLFDLHIPVPSAVTSSSIAASLGLSSSSSAPPSPFTAPYWLEAHVGLQQLMRNRYSAPQGGFASRDCPGVLASKLHCIKRRGWGVLLLQQSEVEAALGGLKRGRVKVGESYDYSGLQQLLRTRLQV